jgi:transposase
MARVYKKHSNKFKAKIALEAIKEQRTSNEISSEHGIAPSQISAWKKILEDNADMLFGSNEGKNHQAEIDRLHRVIGQVTAERDFLDRALNHKV